MLKIRDHLIKTIKNNHTKEEQEKAEKAALSTAKYLWNFLSGMTDKYNLKAAA